MLTTFLMAGILLVAKIYFQKETKKDDKIDELLEHRDMINKLDFSFSFAKIADSKFIGLFIFLTSNLITGLVNLNMNTLRVSDYNALVGLCIYSMISFAIPFSFYFFNKISSKSIKKDK